MVKRGARAEKIRPIRLPEVNEERGGTPALHDAVATLTLDDASEHIDARTKLTLLDLVEAPRNASDEKIFEWVARWTGRNIRCITENGYDAEQFYSTLEKVFHKAIAFTRTEWGWAPYIENYFPKADETRYFARPNLDESRKLLISFIRQTARYDAKNELSPKGTMYCVLVKLMYALFQLEQKQVHEFISLSDSIDKAMSTGVYVAPKGEYIIEPLFKQIDAPATNVQQARHVAFNISPHSTSGYTPSGKPILRAHRGKSQESALIKLLQPRGTIENFIKDGLGIRYVCERDDMPFIIENEILWLHTYYGIESIILENEDMYSKRTLGTFTELANNLRSNTHLADISQIIDKQGDVDNTASSGKFKALKVLVKLRGDNRYVELQLMTPFTKRSSERGESDHAIYEAARVIAGQVRVLGYLTESTYEYCIDKAVAQMYPRETDAEKILEHKKYISGLLDSTRGVRKMHSKNKQVRVYVKEDVFVRWRNLGLITPEACAEAIKATKALREAKRKEKK